MNIQNIALEKLEPNDFQYRREITDAQVRELADSIEDVGVLQPILVRPITGKKHKGVTHQIVAGERRWRASRLAYQKTIPAIVRSMSDIEALSIALIENTQRDDPDDWATAQGIKQLMELHAARGNELSKRAVAKLLQKSVSYVTNHLNLFELRPALQEVAKRHASVKSSLFEIQKVRDEQTERDLLDAVVGGASFSAIKARVIEHLESEKQKKAAYQAPDRETQQRSAEYSRSGGGGVSRGRQLKGNTAAEAVETITGALQSIGWKLDTIDKWENLLSEKQKAKLTPEFRRLAARLEAKAEGGRPKRITT
jgi:ParB family chromosome partitioning protein